MSLTKNNEPAEESKPATNKLLKVSSSLTIPTLFSRFTGFIKSVLLVAILGDEIASSFSVANQFPNFISELLLGAVLTAVIVPVLIRSQEEDSDGGQEFLNKLFTLVITVISVATLISLFLAPLLSKIFLGDGKVSLKLTTIFALLLLPQIIFYGLSALFSATLNVHDSFLPAGWSPVLNNIIGLATLGLYYIIPGEIDTSNLSITNSKILILGIGTTLGIVTQTLFLLPFLKKNNVKFKISWGIDARLKQFSTMAFGMMLYVFISLAGLAISLRISSAELAAGPAIYNNSWSILQLPYGVLGVAILTASMPNISRALVKNDNKLFINRLTSTINFTILALTPFVILLTFYGKQLGVLLFEHGKFIKSGEITGKAIAFSAFTLIPYSLLLINLRVLYAKLKTIQTVYIILVITISKIVFSYFIYIFTNNSELIVIWQGFANGIGFIFGAGFSFYLLKHELNSFSFNKTLRLFFNISIVSLIAASTIKLVESIILPNFNYFVFTNNLIFLFVIFNIFIALTFILFINLPSEFSKKIKFRIVSFLKKEDY